MVKRIFQITAWLLLLAIAGLSLVSPWYRPVTNIPHALEHFAIFFATGLAFGLGYSTPYLYRLIPLISFTAAVEIAQLWVPGRHARFSDFLINVLGVGIGLGLGLAQDGFRDHSTLDR
jgi:VanZ family protein